MNPRIRAAVDNVQRHESKAQAFMTKVVEAKGLVIPLALTSGVVAVGTAIPSISDSISSFVDLLKASADSVGALKDAHPRIFYGLTAGLVAGGALLAGIGFLENRDEKKNNQRVNDEDAALNFQQAWEEIVRTNSSITEKVAQQQAWAVNTIRSNPETNGILRKNGFNPQDKAALIDLQRAYIHGVKNAFVTAREDGKRAEISGSTFDQYTNKNIMRGMVSFYKELGYSTTPGLGKKTEAFEIVSSGFSAILELKAEQGLDVTPITQRNRKNDADRSFTR